MARSPQLGPFILLASVEPGQAAAGIRAVSWCRSWEGGREGGREGRKEGGERGGGREGPAPGDDGAQRCVQREGRGWDASLGRATSQEERGLQEAKKSRAEGQAGLLSLEAAQRSWLGLRNLGAYSAFAEDL